MIDDSDLPKDWEEYRTKEKRPIRKFTIELTLVDIIRLQNLLNTDVKHWRKWISLLNQLDAIQKEYFFINKE